MLLMTNVYSSLSQNDMYRRIFEIMMNDKALNSDLTLDQKVYTIKQNAVGGAQEVNTTISVYSKDGQTKKIKEESIVDDNVTQRIYYFMNGNLSSVKEIVGKVQDSIATFNYGEPLVIETAQYFFNDDKLYESRLNPAEDKTTFNRDFDPFLKEKELLSALNKVLAHIESNK